MRIRIQQIKVPLGYDDARIRRDVMRRLSCEPALLGAITVVRRSLDARPRNPEPLYVLQVEVDFSGDLNTEFLPDGIELAPDEHPLPPPHPIPARLGDPRPIVVGAGPAGLLAAHTLARAGAKPLLIDRGDAAAARAPKAARFWNDGALDPESNILYGEGGAGLFSDGKLTARSKERGRVHDLMALLHACGAEESILIDSEPHLGSDLLLDLVPRLRRKIEEAGGEARFQSRLDGLVIENGVLRALIVNGVEIACSRCVLAPGHSARDVAAMLAAAGVTLTPKPFAMGVRLELPQAAIDRAQYGPFAGDARLGAASFRLTRKEEQGLRACYSFCMCPGGKVIACASEPGGLTTNGMSYSKRRLPGGNAAFLVPVEPSDYPDHAVPALAGARFQWDVEKKAFEAAGGTYAVPAQRLVDFMARRETASLPEGLSCRSAPADLRLILPACILPTLERAIPAMLREMRGVRLEDCLLYAPETRSSSPWRIERGPECESVSTRGLFPAGEGAGYAGGIVSSAIDGRRAAEGLLLS